MWWTRRLETVLSHLQQFWGQISSFMRNMLDGNTYHLNHLSKYFRYSDVPWASLRRKSMTTRFFNILLRLAYNNAYGASPLWQKSAVDWWFPHKKTSNAENVPMSLKTYLCFWNILLLIVWCRAYEYEYHAPCKNSAIISRQANDDVLRCTHFQKYCFCGKNGRNICTRESNSTTELWRFFFCEFR